MSVRPLKGSRHVPKSTSFKGKTRIGNVYRLRRQHHETKRNETNSNARLI